YGAYRRAAARALQDPVHRRPGIRGPSAASQRSLVARVTERSYRTTPPTSHEAARGTAEEAPLCRGEAAARHGAGPAPVSASGPAPAPVPASGPATNTAPAPASGPAPAPVPASGPAPVPAAPGPARNIA